MMSGISKYSSCTENGPKYFLGWITNGIVVRRVTFVTVFVTSVVTLAKLLQHPG
jgi:hypothetical protein